MPEIATPPGGEGMLAGHRVARVGLGVMQLAERHGREPISRDEALALLRRAVDLGINHFDTAAFYGAGAANELIRTALTPYRDDIVLATKVGAINSDGPRSLVPAQKPSELRAQVEANLTGLGVERLGVVNLRRADIQPGIIATGDQLVDLDDQLAELIALREEGKIGGIGLSTVHLAQLEQALPAGIVCVQNMYSLLDRRDEAMLAVCLREGIAWVPYFPLGSAFPQLPNVTDQPTVRDAAAALGVTPAQLGLAWLLQHAPNILLISGTSDVGHLVENSTVGDIRLDAGTVAALDALAQ